MPANPRHQTPIAPFRVTGNHNQTLVRISPGTQLQHNQTMVQTDHTRHRRVTANHNQTVIRTAPTVWPQHNQTVVRPSR